MAKGLLSVWARDPKNCSVVQSNGYVWARNCCTSEEWHEAKLKDGHAQFEVPPGCYIVGGYIYPGCCGMLKETMVIVKCDETVCVNLLRDYRGDPIRSIKTYVAHAREAKIPEEEIEKFVRVLEKIAETAPKGEVRRYTKRELELIEEVSDKAHKDILEKYRSRLQEK